MKADLDDRLYRMYDKIESAESKLIEARAKKQSIEAEKLTGDNIYKVLIISEDMSISLASFGGLFFYVLTAAL